MARCRIESLGVSPPLNGLWRTGSLTHAVRAGREALERSNYNPTDIALLINAGVFRDRHYAEPAFACFIQEKLGINVEFQGRQTLSFDLQNGGCGLLSAAHVVDSMLRSRTTRVGMIVASEANADRTPDPSFTYAPSGAAAILDVSPHSDRGFGAFAFETFDQHLDLYGAVVSLARANGQLFVRKSPELEDAYLDCAPKLWDQLLAKEGLDPGDVDLVVPSQISGTFLDRLAPALDLPRDRLVDITAQHGDTLTTSWMLALSHARDRELLTEGNKAVFLAFGSGVTIGGAVYYA